MSKKKQKAIQRSIYFEPDVLHRLENDMLASDRKISGEVNHNLKKLFAIRDKNDAQALAIAFDGEEMQKLKEGQDNQPQS